MNNQFTNEQISSSIICTNCNASNPANQRFCGNCGTALLVDSNNRNVGNVAGCLPFLLIPFMPFVGGIVTLILLVIAVLFVNAYVESTPQSFGPTPGSSTANFALLQELTNPTTNGELQVRMPEKLLRFQESYYHDPLFVNRLREDITREFDETLKKKLSNSDREWTERGKKSGMLLIDKLQYCADHKLSMADCLSTQFGKRVGPDWKGTVRTDPLAN